MKVRNDFITNSSSSSFIMAFKDDDRRSSFECFANLCMDLDYIKFYKLIKKLKKNPENTDKEKALELLRHCYSCDYKLELLESSLNRNDYEDYRAYFAAKIELEKSEEFQNKVNAYLNQNQEYLDKKKQIEDADEIVQGTIWNSSGGLLEWAIRNGFIEDNFWNNSVIVWNVG